MGCSLDRWTQMSRGCFLPLRAAVVVAGLVGLPWAALYLFLFSAEAARMVAQAAGEGRVAGALRPAHCALGVWLCALHVILLVGVARRSDALCAVYVWVMPACWLALQLTAIAFAAAAVLAGNLLPAALVLLSVLLSVLVSSYFVVVVINYRQTIP